MRGAPLMRMQREARWLAVRMPLIPKGAEHGAATRLERLSRTEGQRACGSGERPGVVRKVFQAVRE